MTGPHWQSPAWKKQYRLDRELGRARQTPSGPIVEHIESLRAAGWSMRSISQAAGLDDTAVGLMLRRRAPMVRTSTARAILALTPHSMLDAVRPDQRVPSVGSLRRVRALLALGWTHEHLYARSGIRTSDLARRPGAWVERSTHDTLAAMYDELCMTVGPSALTRSRAAASGYAPPLAWDDIDDPDEQPDPATVTTLTPRRPGAADVMSEWLHLVRNGGLSHEDAWARLGTNRAAMEQAAYRNNRADVLDLIYPARRAAS